MRLDNTAEAKVMQDSPKPPIAKQQALQTSRCILRIQNKLTVRTEKSLFKKHHHPAIAKDKQHCVGLDCLLNFLLCSQDITMTQLPARLSLLMIWP